MVGAIVAKASQVATLPALFNTKVGATLLPNINSWYLVNMDTFEMINGPYQAETSRTGGSQYANTFALNRKDPIKSFLHGKLEAISFTARLYAIHSFQDIQTTADKLISWSERDEQLGRPPLLYFWVGDRHVSMATCVMPQVDVVYDPSTFFGAMRGAQVSISLEKYEEFSLDEKGLFDTRYHKVKLGDTYEMLTAREYGSAMLGVEIRNRHPEQRVLKPGDVVKLPSRNGGIRRTKVEPKSVALSGILNRRKNAQKLNLEAVKKRHMVAPPRYVTR